MTQALSTTASGDGDKVAIVEYVVYCKAAFIDRSRLDLCIKSRYNFSDVVRTSSRRLTVQRSQKATGVRSSTERREKSKESTKIRKFKVFSNRSYEVTTCKVGSKVYTDSEFVWSHVPPFLCEDHMYISTSDADRKVVVKELINFELDEREAFVIVLMDGAVKNLPRWLVNDGYNRCIVAEPAVAKMVKKGGRRSNAALVIVALSSIVP